MKRIKNKKGGQSNSQTLNEPQILTHSNIDKKHVIIDPTNKKFKCTKEDLNKHGDYLYKVFIKVDLPAIYSSNERQFKWIKNLGYAIVKKATCTITFTNNNITPITLNTYAEWMYIWYEINLSNEEKINHNELIGNVPELYDPANANGRNNIYPASHIVEENSKWLIDDRNTKKASVVPVTDYNINKPASIPARTLYIPLNFYFCNDLNTLLPLNNASIKNIEIELNPDSNPIISNLYTMLLIPEDFKNVDTNINITKDSTDEINVKLDNSEIEFVNITIPNFHTNAHYQVSNINDLSMYDVLINKYEIISKKGSSRTIGNFINNIDKGLGVDENFWGRRIQLVCEVITPTIDYSINKLHFTGLLNIIEKPAFLNTDIGVDGTTSLNIKDVVISQNSSRIKELFFICRHDKRIVKNDLFNFTNLDYNNKKPWSKKDPNVVTYSSNIELISDSIWEHEGSNTSIRLGIDNLGVFYIKKHILENNIFKYIDIINYKAKEDSQTRVSKYKSSDDSLYTNYILKSFSIKIDNTVDFTTGTVDYDFYNKTTIYNNYKNTVPGLYYVDKTIKNTKFASLPQQGTDVPNPDSNPDSNIQSQNNQITIDLKETKYQRIKINNEIEPSYTFLGYFIEEVEVNL